MIAQSESPETANRTAIPEPLSSQEALRLRELESIIQEGFKSFLEVGIALAEVRQKKLYRSEHASFEAYCKSRWSLSVSRSTQLISTVGVFDNIVTVFPQDARLLSVNLNEHALRPLTKLRPELQTAAWELIRALRSEPDTRTIARVVDSIKEAIEGGWQELSAKQPQGAESQQPRPTAISSRGRQSLAAARRSGELGALCRWAARISTWDAEAIALVDDQTRLASHLKAARQLRTFCETFIQVIEGRLSHAS